MNEEFNSIRSVGWAELSEVLYEISTNAFQPDTSASSLADIMAMKWTVTAAGQMNDFFKGIIDRDTADVCAIYDMTVEDYTEMNNWVQSMYLSELNERGYSLYGAIPGGVIRVTRRCSYDEPAEEI